MIEQYSRFELWACLHLSEESVSQIHNFFRDKYGISSKFLIKNMHLTVYHARRPLNKISPHIKTCDHTLDVSSTRFMVLAPGGENPREDLVPATRKVGIRIQKQSAFREDIYKYRDGFVKRETKKIVGNREASTNLRSAFGARNFQPHITLLRAGSGIQTDLKEVGELFRNSIKEIHFDRFIVSVTKT